MNRTTPYDVLVIGGGINGCGVAADAAGRGLSVLLAEQGDLAGGTSSASSKLIHGGLRYLEHCEFRLVREALQEREVLLRTAGHLVRPLRFVMPHFPEQRPAWLIRAGLFLYDHLARRERIPGSASVRLTDDPAGAALRSDLRGGFSYWDCWADDARLVVANALAAARRGAEIRTRSPVVALRREGLLWRAMLGGAAGPVEVAARAVVNAAGPWVDTVAQLVVHGRGGATAPRIRLVRGSHLVVPRIPGGDSAFLLQNRDGRVVFLLPFEERFTLVGTTDVPHVSGLERVDATDAEVDYLLDIANRALRRPLTAAEVVWRFAGIRPLDGAGTGTDPSALSRDWRLEVDVDDPDQGAVRAPRIDVIGGKITTYRRLAEAVLDRLAPWFPGLGPRWTAAVELPGSEGGAAAVADVVRRLAVDRPGLDASYLGRLAGRHGTAVAAVVGDARTMSGLGECFGAHIYAAEVAYLRDHEWAREPADVLWRRTREGLHLRADERAAAMERIGRML